MILLNLIVNSYDLLSFLIYSNEIIKVKNVYYTYMLKPKIIYLLYCELKKICKYLYYCFIFELLNILVKLNI